MIVIEPNISIKPGQITIFSRVLTESGDPFRRPKHEMPHLPNSNKHNGKVSSKAKGQILAKVDWMSFLCQSKQQSAFLRAGIRGGTMAMVTLTLPARQMHADSYIKSECLNHFLTVLRTKFHIKHYIWKAELQKNNNIHFHIIIDRYVHYSRINILWNNIIGKLGYIREYQHRMQSLDYKTYCKVRRATSPKELAAAKKAWQRGLEDGFTSPNSTDIRRLNSIRNIRSYLAKYLTKSLTEVTKVSVNTAREAAFTGRIWACSGSLSRLKSYVTIFCNQASAFFAEIANSADSWIKEYDYATVLRFDPEKIPPNIYREYKRILNYVIYEAEKTLHPSV